MNSRHPVLLDHLASLADTTRSRMLLVLDRRQLTVGEICAVMQLPQSTVSRHLKTLADGGWVASHPEGTSNRYAMTLDEDLMKAGIPVGIALNAGKPQVILNVAAARAIKAEFSSSVMRIARILQ